MEHDQVKWLDGSQTRYGLCYGKYGSFFSKKEPRPGYVFVNEALTGRMHEVPEVNLTDIPAYFGTYNQKTGEFENQDEYHTYVQNELKKALEISDKAGPGLQVGKLFAVGVADGTAWYVVTQVNKRNCNIEWRGYDFDRYRDQVLGWGGNIPKKNIEHLVR